MTDPSSFLFAKAAFAKIIGAMVIGIGACIADIAMDAKGFEDWTLKGILIASIVFVVRILLKQQAEHKAEMKVAWDEHKREFKDLQEKTIAALERGADSTDTLVKLTAEQTQYYQTVAKVAVDDRMRGTAHKP